MNKRKLTIILILLISLLILSLAVYFLNQKFHFLADTVLNGIPTFCKLDSDCSDGFSYTDDKCFNPGTAQAICKHTANRPIVFGSGTPAVDNTNYLDMFDVFGLINNPFKYQPPTDTVYTGNAIASVKQKVGNDATDIRTLSNSDLLNSQKMTSVHVSVGTLIKQCHTYTPDTPDISQSQIDSCSQTMADYMNNNYLRVTDTTGSNFFRSIVFDELLAPNVKAVPNNYKAITGAFIKVKQLQPKISIFVWGRETSPDTYTTTQGDGTVVPTFSADTLQVVADVIKAADYYLPEIYYDSAQSSLVSLGLSTATESWSNFFKKYGINIAGVKILPGIVPNTAEGMERGAWDISSYRDFFAMLDEEFRTIKDEYNKGHAGGIALWQAYSPDQVGNQSLQTISQLINHYFRENGNDLLFKNPTELIHIGNSGFEAIQNGDTSGTVPANWLLTPSSGGKIERELSNSSLFYLGEKSSQEQHTNNYLRFGGMVRVPESDMASVNRKFTDLSRNNPNSHDIKFTRGSDANQISQPIASLTAGKNYQFTLYSKKMSGDYAISGVKSQIIGANSQPIDQLYKKETYYNVQNNLSYMTFAQAPMNQTLAECRAHDGSPTTTDIKIGNIGESAFDTTNLSGAKTVANLTPKTEAIWKILVDNGWLTELSPTAKKKITIPNDPEATVKTVNLFDPNNVAAITNLFTGVNYTDGAQQVVFTTADIGHIVAVMQKTSGCNNEQNLWTKETTIFKYSGGNLTLSVDDSQATEGDINIADFAQLQPYYVPPIALRVDKSVADYNDIITYTAEYHNYSGLAKTNVVLSVPVTSSMSFVSASNDGNFADNKVSWPATASLGSNQSLFYTFRLKAQAAGTNIVQASASYAETASAEQSIDVSVQTLAEQNPTLPVISSINITEGQIITTNPYIISIKLNDPADTVKVSKVEFYVDNALISTATLPDVSGTYQAVWDTSKYHSVVKVIVYHSDGTTEEITRNTSVQLTQNSGTSTNEPIIGILPKTGGESWLDQVSGYFKTFIRSIIN